MEAIATKKSMKRTTISIPEDLYDDLEAQAESEHRTVQNLMVWAGQKYIDECKANGTFPTNNKTSDTQESAGEIVADIMREIMGAIARGEEPNIEDLDIVANYMNLTLSETRALIEKMRNGNGKKSKASVHR